jgi:exopolyphosphatase/guanosine-5'-triphosphate,3'-diphosphate pyrophosphatase
VSHAPVRLAAIDIGTVTTRLLIADVDEASIVEVERSTDITHLGEGLARTGHLSSEAIGRVTDVVSRYAAATRASGAVQIVAVATSAARDARNGEEFLAALATHGIHPLIIEGSREAYLSFLGATWGLAHQRVMVDDIGGGSTEIIIGQPASGVSGNVSVERARSFDIGSRRLTEAFMHSDPPTRDELESVRAEVATALKPFYVDLDGRIDELISVAGTATTLAAIRMGMAEYDPSRVHGSTLALAQVTGLVERLAAMTLEQRKNVPGLHPGRAAVIVAGALILEQVMTLAERESTRVSERDILYGMLLDAFASGV